MLRYIIILFCLYNVAFECLIEGDSVGIDVNSVNVNGQFNRYSVTVCGYGYLGDLLKDSENKRWMGPKRYDWSGKGV